jgi:iron complex outermembrane recepter protein
MNVLPKLQVLDRLVSQASHTWIGRRLAKKGNGEGLLCGWRCRFLLFTVLLMPSGVSAQNPGAQTPVVLPGIVVTGSIGSAVSPDVQTAKQLLDHYPGATSLVTSQDFSLGRGSYLEDYIRFEPGVLIQSAQGSEDTKVSIRGSGIQSDDIAGLELLIDGMPLNQADGEAFLHDIDLRSAKYAEVFRGADALRYGSVTLGGAINFVTLTGRDVDSLLTTRFSGGSFGFTEQEAIAGWTDGPFDGFVSILNHTLEGFRDWSQENYQKLFASLGYLIGDSMENRAYFFFGRLDQNNPSSLTKEEMFANPQQTEPEAIQEKWNTSWTYYRLVDRFVVKGDEWSLQLGAYWNYRQQTQRQEFEDDFRLGTDRFWSDDFGADIAFISTADFLAAKNRFVIGFLPTIELESDSWYTNENGTIGSLIADDYTIAANLSMYAENQHYLSKSFSILTGFQAVFAPRVFHDGLDSPTLGNQSHVERYYAFNPKLGFAYEWNKACMAYANVSRSFQPPSFDESLRVQEGTDGGEVFHALHAQTAITLELGTRGELGIVSWDFAIYRSWVRNELLDLNNNQGVPLGTVNAAKTLHQGIELQLEVELAHSLLVRNGDTKKTDRIILEQSYTLNDFHFQNDVVYRNNEIAGIPSQFYKGELRYEHPCGFYFATNVEWNIVKYPVDEANTLFADPYALLGVRAGYKTTKGFEIFFEAKNLTNKIYAATVEPIADARIGQDADSFNPGNGRAFYGGVSWAW